MAEVIPPDPIKVPFDGVTGTFDCEDIRHFIWDRTVADNPIELDLTFTDAEIGHASRYACMMFNALPPHILVLHSLRDVTDARLTYSMMLGVVYHIFLAKAVLLSRKDIDYTAGNMQVDFTKRRIEYLTKWAAAFKEEATAGMSNYKLVLNLNDGFCAF